MPTNRLLVKLRPSGALRAAASSVPMEPLYPTRPDAGFGVSGAPEWFVAQLSADAATPWDVAHAQVAAELGVAESDVLFAEPDLVQQIYRDGNEVPPGQAFGAGETCNSDPQDGGHRKAVGSPAFAWHLDDGHSQLGGARAATVFAEPRTRIAHLDTGYSPKHRCVPAHLLRKLERNFVERDGTPGSASDPDNQVLLFDNSGHGTGTLGILAGGPSPENGDAVLGGAPEAEVIPLRIADSVVLLRTSALARALAYAVEQRCDVATLSMGGLPSQAWAEAVDAAYEAGLCLCAAAGNRIGISPPSTIVYPARYARVIAVCGAMADDTPYADLDGFVIEGCFGPESAMATAIAAYTPNIPWPRFGCETAVRLNGEGTSAATPQVAAAVALWFEKYKRDLPRDWRRVEAARHALFTAAGVKNRREHFGNGVLRASDALRIAPRFGLAKSPISTHRFAFLRLLTGIGIVEPPPREHMFNLEFEQRWLMNPELQKLLPDPESIATLERSKVEAVMAAIIEDQGASLALRRHVASRFAAVSGRPAPSTPATRDVVPVPSAACDQEPALTDPPFRRVRVYGLDPSLSTRLDTADLNEVTLKLRWEPLGKGPQGEYLEIVDTDATGRTYKPVDLDERHLLAQDGWAPSEGNPQFHQQMVYAVAMRTVESFERALGRPVLWRPTPVEGEPHNDSRFTRRLVIRPHALRQANAFYSPRNVDLRFGYFEAAADRPGEHMPGSRVYSCLSHDIIAHETTHAILDGMYRRFNEPTNPDVLALHEGFADIVALMQHFTIPEILEREIARTRGDIESESMLGSLAVQFGQTSSGRGALREAIGSVENGVWRRFKPNPADMQTRLTPHSRGAILVGAIFDAFIAIYNYRTADLLRIATSGTGVLPSGAIHPDLVRRLASEASKSATHVLDMCIRALDYLPPVDVTFFEFLRALITADADIVSDDRYNYRIAFVEAFRRRAIYPSNLGDPDADIPRTLSVDTLRWQGGLELSQWSEDVQEKLWTQYGAIVRQLKAYANACFYLKDRRKLFEKTRQQRILLHRRLEKAFQAVPQFATELGLDLVSQRSFEVHELRRAMRVSRDGRHMPQLIVALTQSRQVQNATPPYVLRGGATLVIDLDVPTVRYRIVKRINSPTRAARTEAFVKAAAADPLRGLLFSPDADEPFAALHAFADEGGH